MEIEFSQDDINLAMEEFIGKRFPNMKAQLKTLSGRREPQAFGWVDEVSFTYHLEEK